MQTKKITILTILLAVSTALLAQNREAQIRPGDRLNSTVELNQIELFPNPATDAIIVNIKDTNLSNVKIELRSMIGNKLTIDIEKIGTNRYRIPLKDFATGYYFVVIKDEFLRFNKAYKILKK